MDESTKEIWKDVPGYGNRYQVSSLGRVWDDQKTRFIKPFLSGGEYLTVVLVVSPGIKDPFSIHRIMGIAFFGVRTNSMIQINHKDCNKLNNKITNLELVTTKQNVNHAFDNGCYNRGKNRVKR